MTRDSLSRVDGPPCSLLFKIATQNWTIRRAQARIRFRKGGGDTTGVR
jgi:hypothetical protein